MYITAERFLDVWPCARCTAMHTRADTMFQSAAHSTLPAGQCRARTLMKAPGALLLHLGKQLKPSAEQLELVIHTDSSRRAC